MAYSSSERLEKSNVVLDYAKGLIVSMMISFALVIGFAFSLKWIAFNDSAIIPVNLAIKVISVVVGAIIAVKGEQKGLFKGVIFGFLYMVIAFSCFSILANTFALDLSFILDLICSAIAGGIVGIIKVNRK